MNKRLFLKFGVACLPYLTFVHYDWMFIPTIVIGIKMRVYLLN